MYNSVFNSIELSVSIVFPEKIIHTKLYTKLSTFYTNSTKLMPNAVHYKILACFSQLCSALANSYLNFVTLEMVEGGQDPKGGGTSV